MRYTNTMLTLLLTFHIVSLSLSLIAILGSVFSSVLGRKIPARLIITNNVVTTLGILAGTALLLQAPLDAKCITLTAYLLSFVGAQLYVTNRNQRLAGASGA